jgi:hypothetical protein
MSTSIPEVDNVDATRSAEFVKLTIKNTDTPDEIVTYSTSYRTETIDGTQYIPAGGLLSIGAQHRDLRVTSYDTTIVLTGLDPGRGNIQMVLGKPLRGSEIVIYRGFYDENYNLINTVKRFTGVVTTYSISESVDIGTSQDIFTVSINCSSYKTVLENNTGGRRTNRDDWVYLYGNTDTSMDAVEKLNGAYFDFGVPVK